MIIYWLLKGKALTMGFASNMTSVAFLTWRLYYNLLGFS